MMKYFASFVVLFAGLILAVPAPVSAQQVAYPIVEWNITQVQGNYNIQGDVWFINYANNPNTLEIRFGGSVNNLSIPLTTINSPTSPASFATVFDPAVAGVNLTPGDRYYVGLFSDGALIAFTQTSAYQTPSQFINVDWSDPMIFDQAGEPYIRLLGSVNDQSGDPDPISLTLGKSGFNNQLEVQSYTTTQISFNPVFFKTFTDIVTGQTETIESSRDYYTMVYKGTLPVSGIQVGAHFPATQTQTTGTQQTVATQAPAQTATGPDPSTIIGNPQVSNSGLNAVANNLGLDVSALSGGLVPCDGTPESPCGFNEFIQLVENFINFIFLMVIPIAAIMFTIAGAMYITGASNPEKRKRASGLMLNMVIGVIFIMTAWLIVVTILRTLGVDESYSFLVI